MSICAVVCGSRVDRLLTAVLCGGHPGARVVSATVDGGSDGSSVRRRITVTYNDAGRRALLPEHLFD